MSRGVADNRDAGDANLSFTSGPITSHARPDAATVASASSVRHDASNAQSQRAQSTTSTTTTVTNGASNFQSTIDLRERSPDPHLGEMTDGMEGETEFLNEDEMSRLMRMNGDGSGSSSSSSSQEAAMEVFDPDLRRVKLYELVGSRWTDRGTAFCCGEFDSDIDEARLIVKAEGSGQEILSCRVRAQDVYQRQQDTLIVWTEPDGTDFALSFQDVEGCSEVWEFITEVQKHLNSRGTLSWIYEPDPEVCSAFEDSDDSDITLSAEADFNQVPSTAAQIISSGHLPPPVPDAVLISEIEKAIRTMARTAKSREAICNYIQENRYIHQLLESFQTAEKTENLEALHALCGCMQTILLLNEHSMYEHILQDELWLGVVGMLEYDPEFPKFKANYREFLLQHSHFIQPIAIRNEEVQRKIHLTYRLQYLKDVILGRALDDSTFNVLNSSIIFNQIDIISHIQKEPYFLTELVSLFIRPSITKGKAKANGGNTEMDKPAEASAIMNGVVSSPSSEASSSQSVASDGPSDIERKKEVISLLQQLCMMGKNVQLPTRIALFKTLVDHGVLYALQWALCRPERHIVSTAGEILTVLLDHHSQSVRNHALIQAVALGQPAEGLVNHEAVKLPDITNGGPPPFKETISQLLCRMMANSQDLAIQTQLADALRLLVDTPPEAPAPPPESQQAPPGVPAPNLFRPMRDENSTERFLDNFYKVCIETLMRPLTQGVPDHHELKDASFKTSRERGNLYLYLCDLLCSFATQHSFRSYFFIVSSNVVSRVASLLSVRDKHLCLAALRFFRICLKMNNRNLFNHMNKHECFTPVFKLTAHEAKRENLLSSACQEFFEFVRKENLRELINYVMDKHEAEVRELAKSALGRATFQGFVARWEMNKEPLPPETEKKPAIIVPPRILGQRIMESEEDDAYFNGDDNDEDAIVPVPRVDSFLGLFRRKRQRISAPGPHAQMNKSARLMGLPPHNRPTSPLSSLLEYDDEEEASNPMSNQTQKEPSTPQAPITPHRQIQILPYDPSQDEPSDPEDELLESLVSKEADQKVPSGEAPLGKPEKRRRGDDEDDAFERLAPKNRRLSDASAVASQAAAAKARSAVPSPSPGKPGEESSEPKKLKLRFNAAKQLAQAKPADSPPRSDSKK